MRYIAKTFQGLEGILKQELIDIGLADVEVLNRSVAFEADFRQLMQANLCLRTALRIYQPLIEFDFENEQQLYNKLLNYDWSLHLSLEKTFAIESVVLTQQVRNTHFISLKTKDAIVDYFYKKKGKRPNVDVRFPDIRFQIYISKTNKCVLSIDTSGESLYKRGYKKRQTEASINECLAAGMLLLTDWRGKKDFYDMMAGSGTLTAEALMLAQNYPVNLNRKQWAFQSFQEYKAEEFEALKKELTQAIKEVDIDFYVNEKSGEAFDIAKMNIFDLKADTSQVHFTRDNFFEIVPQSKGILVLNPPYDERLEIKDIELWYKDMGDMLKRHYVGFEVWIISSNKNALKKIGLKSSKRFMLVNGKLSCEYCQYEIF